MRKSFKLPNSKIISEGLTYNSNDSVNNKHISDIILAEQKGYCAYTDEFISRTDARDIEHFDPNLKNTIDDSYQNWFIVKHQWNSEKSSKWKKFQPILHPTAIDFENRIIYQEGDYMPISRDDIEAKNLIDLLKLDDPGLAEKRKKYINRKKKEINLSALSATDYFSELINDDLCEISYPRAIDEEFG